MMNAEHSRAISPACMLLSFMFFFCTLVCYIFFALPFHILSRCSWSCSVLHSRMLPVLPFPFTSFHVVLGSVCFALSYFTSVLPFPFPFLYIVPIFATFCTLVCHSYCFFLMYSHKSFLFLLCGRDCDDEC